MDKPVSNRTQLHTIFFIKRNKNFLKKNREFENWIAEQMATSMIIMEPYGYREEEEGKYLHIFKLMLQFEDKDEKSPGLF